MALDRLLSLAQGIALMAFAPALWGLLDYFEALLQGRRRAATVILSPYRVLRRRLEQKSVRPGAAFWVFPLGPVALLMAYGVLIFAAPAFGHAPLLRIDLITVMYVLTLARFASCVAVLDGTGPIAALNSARAMYLHLQTEIGLALFLAGVALNRGMLDITALSTEQFNPNPWLLQPQWLLLAAALAVVIVYETGRLPVGSAEGDLELPKGQEGIADQYGGRDRLLVGWAEALKLTFLLVLAVSLFPLSNWPASLPLAPLLTGLTQLAELIILVALLALWEATRPKLRLRKVGGAMVMSVVFSLTAILYALVRAAGG